MTTTVMEMARGQSYHEKHFATVNLPSIATILSSDPLVSVETLHRIASYTSLSSFYSDDDEDEDAQDSYDAENDGLGHRSSTDSASHRLCSVPTSQPPRPSLSLSPSSTHADGEDLETCTTAAVYLLPTFPLAFDVFDSGDGSCYYLGGGGKRLLPHQLSLASRTPQSQPQNDLLSSWPFARLPLYSCRVNRDDSKKSFRKSGQPSMVLYSSASADVAGAAPGSEGAWADVRFGRGRLGSARRRMTIGLPPPGGPSFGSAAPMGRVEEKMRVHAGWWRRHRFRFTIEVQPVEDVVVSVSQRDEQKQKKQKQYFHQHTESRLRRETFEWRHCSARTLDMIEHTRRAATAVRSRSRSRGHRRNSSTSTSSTSKKACRLRKVGTTGKMTRLLRRKRQHKQSKKQWQQKQQRSGARLGGGSSKSPHSRWRGGWQLVRCQAGDEAAYSYTNRVDGKGEEDKVMSDSSSTTAGHFEPQRQFTSDGLEIVATWAKRAVTLPESATLSSPLLVSPSLLSLSDAYAYGCSSGDDDTANTHDENQAGRTSDSAQRGVAAADGMGEEKMEPTSVARFTFLGSGRSGLLGERWALMAVASGMALWEREQRTRRRRRQTVIEAYGGLAYIG